MAKTYFGLRQTNVSFKRQSVRALIVSGLFFQIWSHIFENDPTDSTEKTNVDVAILKDMIGFIQKNYDQKISLDEIARAGYVGQSKCCRLFREYIGQTPIGYLTQYRLNKSLRLLSGTDMTITEIALSAGFSGNSYFAEAFKKSYGKPPLKFRPDKKVK